MSFSLNLIWRKVESWKQCKKQNERDVSTIVFYFSNLRDRQKISRLKNIKKYLYTLKTANQILHPFQVCGFKIDQMWLSIVLIRLNTYTPDLKWENRILKIVSENLFLNQKSYKLPKWNSAQTKKSLLSEKIAKHV